MKILQIISGNDNGGGANHVLNICKYSGEKFQSILGCLGIGAMVKKAEELGLNYEQFNSGTEISDYIKENKVDIVNFHGAKAFFTYSIIKRKINIPAVATVHSNFNQDFINNKMKYYLYTPLSKHGLKSFNEYICVSNYIKELLEKENFKGNKYIVNNGIDFNKISIKQEKSTLRKKLGIKETDFIYINVARIHPVKNQESLIQAFKLLAEEFEEVKLIFIGDGPLWENLVKKTEELGMTNKVFFLGFKETPLDFINSSDINVLTSFSEGGAPPLSFLEAAAVKKTTITTKVGDIEENINSNNIFLINENNVNGIYEKLKEAYKNRNNLEEMGNNLFDEVKEKYSIESFINSYHTHYEKINRRSNAE